MFSFVHFFRFVPDSIASSFDTLNGTVLVAHARIQNDHNSEQI